jgi:predicted HicB family RNase H-like nuclease
MGTSTTEIYSGFKKAFESGQPIPGNEYAAFILASNPDLAKRKVGKQVATEIGEQYAIEKASPGEILRQMSDGRFNARIEQLIVKDEAQAAQKAATSAQKPQSVGHNKEITMVDKVGGAKQERPAIGKFTNMINKEASHKHSEDITQRL